MKKILILLALTIFAGCAPSKDATQLQSATSDSTGVVQSATPESYEMDELDPNDPNIEEKLNQMDSAYIAETGKSPFLEESFDLMAGIVPGCKRETCAIYAVVDKSEQKMYLYENGALIGTYATSTGTPGRSTPNFDQRPNGRIYDKHTSSKYPGGDYLGLGNMPYAVFIHGGYAIHGTGKGNWPKLGKVASHGCIRIHPDNAFIFNRLVRKYGVNQSWIVVKP